MEVEKREIWAKKDTRVEQRAAFTGVYRQNLLSKIGMLRGLMFEFLTIYYTLRALSSFAPSPCIDRDTGPLRRTIAIYLWWPLIDRARTNSYHRHAISSNLFWSFCAQAACSLCSVVNWDYFFLLPLKLKVGKIEMSPLKCSEFKYPS